MTPKRPKPDPLSRIGAWGERNKEMTQEMNAFQRFLTGVGKVKRKRKKGRRAKD